MKMKNRPDGFHGVVSAESFALVGGFLLLAVLTVVGCDKSTPVVESETQIDNGPPPADSVVSNEEVAQGGVSETAVPSVSLNRPASAGEELPLEVVENAESEAPAPGTGEEPMGKLAVGDLVGIEPVLSDDPAEMVRHLEDIDRELRDLVLAGSRNMMEKDQFLAAGRQLGLMKLRAGQHLANLATATDEQRTQGVIAQLVGLSHLSGLGDVESAKKLEQLASQLISAENQDLAHQSLVVLLGFELQAVQNGQRESTEKLLELVDQLFQRDEDRGFTEFMLLQQIVSVLEQLDYQEDAARVRKTISDNYLKSSDPQLRGEAWLTMTRGSQELSNFTQAYNQALSGAQVSAELLLGAARDLIAAFPSGPTLEHLAKAISQLEYSGQMDISRQLADLVASKLTELPESVSTKIVQDLVDAHRRRVALLDQPLAMDGLLVDLNGEPIQAEALNGKVTVVDVWATWCVPCLREIPNLRKLYEAYHQDGLEIIGVSVDSADVDVQEFATKQQIAWPIYRPADGLGLQSEFAKQYGIKLIPFVSVLDRNGRVVRLHVRGDQLEAVVRELLEQENPDAADSSSL